MTRAAAVTVALAFLTALGCDGPRATPDDCRAILDRIVEIELTEQGYRDAVLAEQRKRDLAARLAGELAECVGRPIPRGARGCIAAADSAETISHVCLR